MDEHRTTESLIDKVIHWAFRQQIVVVMLIALATVFGVAAYQQMRRNVYPDILIPVFTIVAENEAMAAEEIEMMITRPLEAAMNGLPGVLRVRSQTTQGLSSVVVEFGIETDFWPARQFVTERMSQAIGQLPPGTEPPVISSATTRLAEVYELAVEGELPLLDRREFAEWQLRYTLLNVPGVAEVLNMGGYLRQYRVTIRPEALQSFDITLAEVEEAIESGNENAAGGFVSTGPTEYTVRGIGRFSSVQDIRDTVVAARSGVPVFLRDLADVSESTAIRRGIATRNSEETVVCLVIKQPTADTVEVVEGIEKALDDMQPTLPEGVRLTPYYDQTHLINASLDSVMHAILFGAVLVVIVLFVFLGDPRSTLIVAASIPLSVGIAGILMKSLGVGLNTMSLGGLAIAIGIMVDASIIMVENIYHRLQKSRDRAGGAPSRAAVARGAAIEVGRPIAFATIIIVAVFLPLFMMGGYEGLLFRPLAITVASAMLVALVISLTVTPVLSLRLLRPRSGASGNDDVLVVSLIKRAYVPVLEYCLTNKSAVILLAFGLLIPAAIAMGMVGKDFMPGLDEGTWVVSTLTPAETSLEENDRITSQIEQILLDNPDVTDTVRRNGRSERAIGCVLPVNSGEIIVNLKPRKERSKPTEKLLAEVREQVSEVLGVGVAFTQPLQLKIDESLEGTPAPLQVKLFGPDIDVLTQKGKQIEELMGGVPGITDLKMDQVSGIPQVQVQVDRGAAARYGVSVGQVSEVVRLAVGGEELTQLWRNQRSYGVFARFPDAIRNDLSAIGGILVDTPSGMRIPLSEVARVTLSEGPNVIWREAMSRRLSINAGIQGRDLGSVVDDIKRGLASISLPSGYYVVFGGQFQNQQRAMRSLALASVVALVVVFMLLFLALGTLGKAAMILASVPSAFIGGVAALLVSGESLNVSSAVGFIALFGIAVQNSLVLLTQTQGYMHEGQPEEQAVRLASVQRLRPKLMTASCTALGLLPVLLSGGVGAEIEKPLAIVMIGGLATSTLFTLLVLPAVYLARRRVGQALGRLTGNGTPRGELTEESSPSG